MFFLVFVCVRERERVDELSFNVIVNFFFFCFSDFVEDEEEGEGT